MPCGAPEGDLEIRHAKKILSEDAAAERERVSSRATARGVAGLQILSNGLGIAVVTLYFAFLYPQSSIDELEPDGINLIVFGSYVAFMLLLALPLNTMFLRRAVAWVGEGREPTAKERKILFHLPTEQTISALFSWLGAAVLFGWVNADVARTSIGIALAGVVTCAMLYLLLEGFFRPLYALALRNASAPPDRRDVFPRLMLAWLVGSGVPLLAIGLSSVLGPGEAATTDRLGWIAGISAIAGASVMALAARSVLRPIQRIRDGLRQVEQGDFDVRLPVDDLGELGRLTQGVNHLAAGLREREELRLQFEKQVGQADLAGMLASNDEPSRVSDRRYVTVLFVDLSGYTSFAERRPPEEVVAMLNRFFSVVVAVVNREGGWVNKFEGDAALCIFGAPGAQHDHAQRAMRAAASIPAELERVGDTLSAGVGIATGEVIAGFVGTQERHEYTVIGDVVNVAARLCDAAKEQTSGVLAADTTIHMAKDMDSDVAAWKPSGRIQIKGRAERAKVFTLRASESVGSRRGVLDWLVPGR